MAELMRHHAGELQALRVVGVDRKAVHQGGGLDDGVVVAVAIAVDRPLGEGNAQHVVLGDAEILLEDAAVGVVDDVHAAAVELAVDLGDVVGGHIAANAGQLREAAGDMGAQG